jgi:formylglycine-generating enzyme required for sulfatase activity
LKLPVLSLNARDLAPWGALVMGDTLARTGGAVLPVVDSGQESPPPSQAPRPVDDVGAEAESLWLEFCQQASPEAQRLMLLMAAAPLLTLPVLRLLMAAELPDLANPLPLAEVLVSGLVRRREVQAGASPDAVQFELLPAVQELLEPQLEPRARVAVIQSITDLLERRLARQGRGPTFETLLSDPKAAARDDAAGLAHFANLTAAMLDRLPGQPFCEIARQLRAAGGSGPMSLWPATMAFEAHTFSTAQLLDTPELESEDFTAARWHELFLQQVEFQTLRPADLAAFLGQVEKEGGAAARASLPTATAWAFHEPLQRDARPPGATAEAAGPLTFTLVEIPAGSFLMGSPPEEPERSDDEGPQHEVKLASFFISQMPITQAQWREVAGWQPLPAERWGQDLNPDPSHFQNREGQAEGEVRLFEAEANTDNRPVENVSWLDAMEFCNRLSQRTGRTYSLPSEAQWEYACRAGTTTPFHFGDTISPELANYEGNHAYGNGPTGIYREQTTPVGMFPANAWGLHDMHGNVWEWCQDEWHESFEGAPTDGRAWVDAAEREKSKESAKPKLLRGGSWFSSPGSCRSAYRNHARPDDAGNFVGFRVFCLPQGPSLNP